MISTPYPLFSILAPILGFALSLRLLRMFYKFLRRPLFKRLSWDSAENITALADPDRYWRVLCLAGADHQYVVVLLFPLKESKTMYERMLIASENRGRYALDDPHEEPELMIGSEVSL